MGGQKLFTARLLGTQLVSTYQRWITYHKSHAFTNQSTTKDLLNAFCWTSCIPGDWRVATDNNVAAFGRVFLLLCLLFLWEPKFRLVKW